MLDEGIGKAQVHQGLDDPGSRQCLPDGTAGTEIAPNIINVTLNCPA